MRHFRPLGPAPARRLEDPAIETLGALDHDAIPFDVAELQPGQTYTFWIDQDDWFKKNYFVLARAKLPTQ